MRHQEKERKGKAKQSMQEEVEGRERRHHKGHGCVCAAICE